MSRECIYSILLVNGGVTYVSYLVLSTLRPVRLGPCHVCGGGKSQPVSGVFPVSEVFCELWGLLLMCAVQLGQICVLFVLFL